MINFDPEHFENLYHKIDQLIDEIIKNDFVTDYSGPRI